MRTMRAETMVRRRIVYCKREAHSLVFQTFRTWPREAIVDGTTLCIGRAEFGVYFEKGGRVVVLTPRFDFGNIDEIIIDRREDGYNVTAVVNGERIPAKDIVLKVPGGLDRMIAEDVFGKRELTLLDLINLILMGLGWRYLRSSWN